MSDRIGQQFGQYRLLRLLGQGGFAEVYLGEHVYSETGAVIKVLHTQVTPEDIGEFQQEVHMLAGLKHSHIVRVLDFGVEDRTPYLVMDYAPGGTLRGRHPKGTRLPLSTVVDYVKQVAQALQYAHEHRVIHRNIKPENMLIGEKGEILLSDFAIALIAQSSRHQSTKDMTGTIAYMAPEQIEGHPRPQSDQYSLAIVAYEWLSGSPPFHGSFTEVAVKHSVTPPPSLRGGLPALSPEVDQVILMALAKKPEERFATVDTFAIALEQASIELPTEQAHLSNSVPPPHPNLLVSEQSLSGPMSEDARGDDSIKMASRNASWYHAPQPRPDLHSPDQSQGDVADVPNPTLDKVGIKKSRKLEKGDHPLGLLPTAWSSLTRSVISHPRYLMLIGLALVIIVGSIVPAMINYLTNIRATMVANEKVAMTATTQAVPTATAAAATASVMRANPNPYPPRKGTLVLYDPLRNNNNGYRWDEYVGSEACQFRQGAYHASSSQRSYLAVCLTNRTSYTNFAFEVRMTILQGGQGGLIFHRGQNPNMFYYFHIFVNGSYEMGAFNLALLTNGHSSAIKTGYGQSNTIAIVANENHFDAYVNNQHVAEVNNSSYPTGELGIFAKDEITPTEIIFSDARVWTF
jgi:eukaryotic-like serine/threonine-protein kinase